MAHIQLSNIRKSFGALEVIKGVDMEIRSGEFMVFVGPSGCGKSTLLRLIAGLEDISDGTLAFDGDVMNQLAPAKRGIAMVFQSYALYPHMTVEQNLTYSLRIRGVKTAEAKKAAEEVAQTTGLTNLLHRYPRELSGGQRKRVFLARALAQEGQVILLDEPFTGVDVTTEEQIIGLMKDLRAEGRVMLVSTHNLGSVPDFCDRTIFVKGTVIASGKTEDTFTEENLKTAFGGALRHFVLSGTDLHDDEDGREVKVITDDERPFVIYGTPKPGAADARDPG